MIGSALVAILLQVPAPRLAAQAKSAPNSAGGVPKATLALNYSIALPGNVDSNSPAVWDLDGGVRKLFVMTSTGGAPHVANGSWIGGLGPAKDVAFTSDPGSGVWMESVVADEAGTWYGYYHAEQPAVVCGRADRFVPRIGAARSLDQGKTWDNLGIILEASPDTVACDSPNRYVIGGVGDLSVALNADNTDLYIFFSQYEKEQSVQGVAVARLLWANRDHPVGRVTVWTDGVWQASRFSHRPVIDISGKLRRVWREYPEGTPIWPTNLAWHDADGKADAFWGPSVHWNESLQMYVMLLNRTKDENYTQEGIYVSFASDLTDPATWSAPQKLMSGGKWYPQVIGLQKEIGTDKLADGPARLFLGGHSDYLITFSK